MAKAKTKTLPLNTPKSIKNSKYTPVSGDQGLARLSKGSLFNKRSAKIKYMVHMLVLLSLFHTTPALAIECDAKATASSAKMVERINQRYDDFFRYQRQVEERERSRNKGRGENKIALEKHEKRIEAARQEYVKNRRPKPDRSDLEAKAEQERKERNAKMEVARRCFVQQQSAEESLLKRGRMIPGNQEFDLQE